jgi:hypothetical protein
MAPIRTGHAYGETPPNAYADFEWAREHHEELLDQYGEQVLLVFHKQVIGIGKTLAEAEHDAEQRIDPSADEITPVTVLLYRRQPFFRAKPANKDK